MVNLAKMELLFLDLVQIVIVLVNLDTLETTVKPLSPAQLALSMESAKTVENLQEQLETVSVIVLSDTEVTSANINFRALLELIPISARMEEPQQV